MRRNDQLVGYALRRSLIAVIAALFGLLWKWLADRFPDPFPPAWLALAMVAMLALTVGALIAIDFLLDRLYAGSRALRRWLGLFDRSFIEGAWVDVGLTGSADSRCASNFSFISITFAEGQHKVSGLSWMATSENPLESWSSEFSSWDRDKLTFWFNDDIGPGREIASRAVYQVTGWTKRTPSSIAGSYKESPGREVQTRSVRVDSAFLKDFRAAHAAKGSTDSSGATEAFDNDALDEMPLRGLSVEQFEARRELAKWHLQRIAVQENLDPSNWTAKNRVRFSKDYADWYTAFLGASDGKAAEFKLLRDFLDHLLSGGKLRRNVSSLLDIGPGNGKLTSAAIDRLNPEKFYRFKYTALEPSFAMGASLQDELFRTHPGIDFRLISQRWRNYIAWNDPAVYDLVLAFHSLYFCDEPLEEISRLLQWVAEGRFRQGAILLHTDWEKSAVLKRLGTAAPDSGLCDVVGMTEHAAKRHALTPIAEQTGELVITFPQLSPAQWKQLREPNNLVNDNAVRTVAQLLAFLINMPPNDDGSWEASTGVLREALESGSSRVTLPLRIQYFQGN